LHLFYEGSKKKQVYYAGGSCARGWCCMPIYAVRGTYFSVPPDRLTELFTPEDQPSGEHGSCRIGSCIQCSGLPAMWTLLHLKLTALYPHTFRCDELRATQPHVLYNVENTSLRLSQDGIPSLAPNSAM
jgi:hypothetical protein